MDLESKLENQGFMERIKDKASSSYGKAMLGLGTLAMAGYASLFGLPGLQSTQPKPAYSYEIPDDSTLRKLMSQPVEETLQGTDYTRVNDQNYDQEVLGADSPVMVLFYGTDDGSQGLGALVKTLNTEFPEIKLCIYNDRTGDSMTRAEFNDLKAKYPQLKTAPAILWYDNDEGFIEYEGRTNGGIKSFDLLKNMISKYCTKMIPKYITD